VCGGCFVEGIDAAKHGNNSSIAVPTSKIEVWDEGITLVQESCKACANETAVPYLRRQGEAGGGPGGGRESVYCASRTSTNGFLLSIK
jgi:hypothetical protein